MSNVREIAWFPAAQDKAVLRQFQFVAHGLQAAILRWGYNPTKIQILKKNISDDRLVQCSKILSRGFFRLSDYNAFVVDPIQTKTTPYFVWGI
jgi:hypothetical protein